jgi:hypothetical protein
MFGGFYGVASLVCVSTLLSCQTYDFEPVSPLAIAQTTQSRNVVARNLKPNLMILVDRSGSMNFPINPQAPECASCNCPQACNCPPTCATNISDLRRAMGQFLTGSGTVARMGVAFFPENEVGQCAPARDVAVPLPPPDMTDVNTAPLTANATMINSRIQSITVRGGTPTAPSLSFFSTHQPLLDDADNRQDFVLLLTDGLPNCNPTNPNACQGAAIGNMCSPANCSQACREQTLDKDSVITAVRQLKSRNVSVIVVGFGPELRDPTSLDVLNSIAAEGGFGRKCPMGTNAECGDNNTCLPSKFCEKQFYQARNAAQLATALADIQNLIGNDDPCVFNLVDKPTDVRFLSVIINGLVTQNGPQTWTLLPSGNVQFNGSLCDRVKSSTTTDPVKVEFRIVNTL